MWRFHRFDKDASYPPQCLFEVLKRRYGVD
jgi:hypothetical protein